MADLISAWFGDPLAASFDVSPLVLVDVGATGGADPRWRRVERHLRIVGFDADQRATSDDGRGRTLPVTVLTSFLHHEAAALPFHQARGQENSSAYRPNTTFLADFAEPERYNVVSTTTMAADTLDAQLTTHGIAGADFLKIDTQGSELSILRGGAQTLRSSVLGVEAEVEFVPVYEGQPLFADVDGHLRREGFVLMDLKPYYWKRAAGLQFGGPKGQLIFADSLYLRDLATLDALVAARATVVERRTLILHLMAVAAVYGYLDYAWSAMASQPALFSDDERRAVERGFAVATAVERWPSFRGRNRIAQWLGRWHRTLQEPHRGWGAAGPPLGNS